MVHFAAWSFALCKQSLKWCFFSPWSVSYETPPGSWQQPVFFHPSSLYNTKGLFRGPWGSQAPGSYIYEQNSRQPKGCYLPQAGQCIGSRTKCRGPDSAHQVGCWLWWSETRTPTALIHMAAAAETVEEHLGASLLTCRYEGYWAVHPFGQGRLGAQLSGQGWVDATAFKEQPAD